MKHKHIVIICFLLALYSCGFRLQDRHDLPPQLQTVYLRSDNPYGTLETGLKNSLKGMGTNFTDTANQAPVTLNIINTSFTHDNPNVVPSSQATVYNFTYSACFNLLDKKGKQITAPQTVAAIHTLTLNPNEVLEASNEVDTIKREMEKELVFKILNRLSAQNTKTALNKSFSRHENKTRTTATKSKQ